MLKFEHLARSSYITICVRNNRNRTILLYEAVAVGDTANFSEELPNFRSELFIKKKRHGTSDLVLYERDTPDELYIQAQGL